MPTNHPISRKILFLAGVIAAAGTVVWFGFRAGRKAPTAPDSPVATNAPGTPNGSQPSSAKPSRPVSVPPPPSAPSIAQAVAGTTPPATKAAAPALRAAPIRADETAAFKLFVWPNGAPHYEGEPVTAYVRVGSSGEQSALSVSQGGEYPRVQVQPREEVQVRLKFDTLAPQTPVAFTAQDGGGFDGGKKTGTMFRVDDARELAFAFTVSGNEGTHRVTFTTPQGETKVLDFWVGPFNTLRKLTRR